MFALTAAEKVPPAEIPEWMALLHRAVESREVPSYARLFLVKVRMPFPVEQVLAAHVKTVLSPFNVTRLTVKTHLLWSQAILHVDRRHLDRAAAKQADGDLQVRAPSECWENPHS